MRKLYILIFLLASFSIFSQPIINDNEWKVYKELEVRDGIVFKENNELFLIEPLWSHYEKNKIDLIGYNKSRVIFISLDSKTYFYSRELVGLFKNIYCPECLQLLDRKINQGDFAAEKTEYPQIFDYSEEKKVYKILEGLAFGNYFIFLDVQVGGIFSNQINIYLKDKNSNIIKSYEAHGSLMFTGIENNLFYIGVIGWGGSGHTGYICFWENINQ